MSRPISFSRRNERPTQWGGPPPRSAFRNFVSMALLIAAFWGTIVAAAYVSAGWVR